MKFWTKNGKFLSKNDKPILCKNPPIDYYAIFGIKYRSLNLKTMEPYSQCGWSYYVAPFEVINNAISWNYISNICLSIDRKNGECLHTKIKSNCYNYCIDYNEETNECINSEESCESCLEIMVYNLTGFYETFQELQEAFYSPCGNTSPYPNIWQKMYGYTSPSEEAMSCIENYWNKYFCDRYMLSYNLIKYDKVQFWTVSVVETRYKEISYCYCYGDNCNGEEINSDDECPSGCEKDCYTDYDYNYPIDAGTNADQYTKKFESGKLVRHYYDGSVSGWVSPCPYNNQPQECWYINCRFINNLYINSTELATNFMLDHINNKESYTDNGSKTFSCNNSDSLCHNFSYKSNPYDNPYGSMSTVRYEIGWAKLRLEKNDNTPSGANGVKFLYSIVQIKRNEGYKRASENLIISSGYLSLYFNQNYNDLPLANNINGLTLIQELDCGENCEKNEYYMEKIITQPQVTFWYHEKYENDVLTDEVQVSLSGIEYI